MSDLDPAIMDQFYMKDGVSASDVTHVSLDTGEILDATGASGIMFPSLCDCANNYTAVSTYVGGWCWTCLCRRGRGLVQMLQRLCKMLIPYVHPVLNIIGRSSFNVAKAFFFLMVADVFSS